MSVTMKSLEALLDKKFKEFEARVLTPVKETIDGMEASLNFMSKQQDDMAKSLKDLQDKNKFLETENSLLRGQLAAVQNDIQFNSIQSINRKMHLMSMNSTLGESALNSVVLVSDQLKIPIRLF